MSQIGPRSPLLFTRSTFTPAILRPMPVERGRTSRVEHDKRLAPTLRHVVQGFAGVLLVFVGLALMFTLWLLPVGLPMVVVGIALVWMPSSPSR